MIRFQKCSAGLWLVLLMVGFVLSFGPRTARAEMQYWADVTSGVQALNHDTGAGDQSADGFTGFRSNLHLYNSITPGVDAYTEVHMTDTDLDLNQVYFTLDNLVDPLQFKVGRFELDYGLNKFDRTDNAEAGGNFFVGNPLVDPFDVQAGAQTTYRAARFYLRGSLTTGTDEPGFSEKRSFGKTVQFHHEPWMTVEWGFSYHAADQSATTENASFLVQPAGEPYSGLASGETTTTTVTSPGAGNDLETYQFDFEHEITPSWVISTTLGQLEDDTGRLSNEMEYINLSLRQTLENNLTLAGQFGFARYEDVGGSNPPGGDVRRLQLAASRTLTNNVLAKVEYVHQEVDDGLAAALPTRKPIEFNGLVTQLHFSF